MESTNIVKIVAAFVAGVVVALGSALIYVRVTDMRPTAPVTQAAVPVPAELPDAGSDGQTQPSATLSSDVQPAPKPVAPERSKVQVPSKPVTERHRAPLAPTALTKPVRKPLLIARNDTRPVMQTAPSETVNQPAPEVAAPQATSDTDNNQPASDNPPVQTPTIEAAAPPAPQPHIVTLPAGTVLSVRLTETLSTDHNYTGDTFRATLLSPVIMNGFIIADRGSKVLGRVVNAQSAGHLASVAGLSLALSEINTTDGQRVPVQTTVYNRSGSSNVGEDAAKIAGGAALGAIIGGAAGGGKGAAIGAGVGGAAGTGAVMLTHGKPAVLASETQLTFRLANPVTITEKLN